MSKTIQEIFAPSVTGPLAAPLRRMAVFAMLLIAFTTSAQAEKIVYECQSPRCNFEVIYIDDCGINIYLNQITYTGNCTSGLFITGYCQSCNILQSFYIGSISHEWGATTHVNPTCTEQGYDWRPCTRCDAVDKSNYVDPIGHLWGDPFGDYVAPTCTTGGGYHHTCQRDGCGVTELDNSVAALGHDWSDNWSTTAPTCSEQGYDWRPCTRCDDLDKTNFVAAIGHTWGADYHCIRGDAELPTITYVKADGTTGSHQAIPITGSEDDDVVLGFENGDTWYYLSGEVMLRSLRLTDRTANIILKAGCYIDTYVGTTIENGSLNIYGQSAYCILGSAIYAHGDVHIHGGYINASVLSAGGDLTLGWTNTNDQFRSSSISVGGTITIAEGKALMNNSENSEIYYGNGTAINAADIAGKKLVPKTDVLCYVGADGHAHFLNDGDYTVLTNETVINPENSSEDAVQWLVVRGNVEFTSDLSLCGTTHLILLDDAVLTASSNTKYALYTERITNIYGSTKGNGRIEVPNGNLYAGGLLNIYGGDIRVSGTFKGLGTKNFSLMRPGNRFYANSYENSAPNIANGKILTDGTNYYSGTLSNAADKTLQPFMPTATGVTFGTSNGNLTATFSGTSTETVNIPASITVKGVTYNRTFTADKASTVMLPFSYTCDGNEGGTFYRFVGVEKDNENKWVATMQETANGLTANTPYLFKPTGTTLTFNIPEEGVILNTTGGGGQQTADQGSHWTFKGTYDYKEWIADGANAAEIGSVYGFAGVAKTGINIGDFVRVKSGAKIRPMYAYLIWSDDAYSAKRRGATDELPQSITVRLLDANGEVTGIGTLDTTTGDLTFDSWYTLQGVKLNAEPTERGIYINNGKKVIVK